MRNVDLAIVGAGFAGLACAEAASTRGLRTTVLDAKPSIGARPHTTGLLVKELADELDVPRRLTRKIHGVRLYSPSGRSIDFHRPGYYFLATNTTGVLEWMARRAGEAGAHVRSASPVRTIQRTGDHLLLNGEHLARFVVGADGAKSPTARRLGLDVNSRFLAGVEAEFEGVNGVDRDFLHVFLDSTIAPGYIAWVVPGVDVTQVGLAVSRPHRPDLDAFITRTASIFDFREAKRVGTRAGRIPVGGLLRRIGDARCLLVGDSAGMVSPLTAGGIHTAVHFGRRAGVSIADYLLDFGPQPARVLRRAAPTFACKGFLRRAWDMHLPNWALNAAFGTPLLRGAAQLAFYHHRGLFDVREWPSVIRGMLYGSS
jgi:flavin-dependent dehydrogenase